jgi:hypothetical protein
MCVLSVFLLHVIVSLGCALCSGGGEVVSLSVLFHLVVFVLFMYCYVTLHFRDSPEVAFIYFSSSL